MWPLAVKKAGFILALLCLGQFIVVLPAGAKRLAPKDVKPVVHEGIRYEVRHWEVTGGKNRTGGFIEAWDVATNRKLWELNIYKLSYDPELEKDVQDVFIASLKLAGDKLVAVNERGEKFHVDINTREVSRSREGTRLLVIMIIIIVLFVLYGHFSRKQKRPKSRRA